MPKSTRRLRRAQARRAAAVTLEPIGPLPCTAPGAMCDEDCDCCEAVIHTTRGLSTAVTNKAVHAMNAISALSDACAQVVIDMQLGRVPRVPVMVRLDACARLDLALVVIPAWLAGTGSVHAIATVDQLDPALPWAARIRADATAGTERQGAGGQWNLGTGAWPMPVMVEA